MKMRAPHAACCLCCRLVDNEGSRQLQQQLLPPGMGGSGRTPDPSQAVKLGQLLGSGSFGR